MIQAVNDLGLDVPVVVRLEGTNVAMGRKILDESDLKIITASDLKDAATKVCEAAKSQEA